MYSRRRNSENGGVKCTSDLSHPTLNLRGGSGNGRRWWRTSYTDTNESTESDSSSEIERSPFRHLRRYVRGLGRTERNETVDLPDPSLHQDQVFDLHRGRLYPSAECDEQPPEVRLPREVEHASQARFGNRPDGTVAISQTVRCSPSQSSPSHKHPSVTFRLPYTFVFAPFPGHTCIGRGTSPLGTISVCIDSNSQLTQPFRYDAAFQSILNNFNCQDVALVEDPVERRHVTKAEVQILVEIRSSEGIVSGIKKRRALVISLLKSYPSCWACKERGRVDDETPS